MAIQSIASTHGTGQISLQKRDVRHGTRDEFSLTDEAALSKKSKKDPAKIAESRDIAPSTIINANTANTLWQTQRFAQSPEAEAVDAEVVTRSVADEFLEYMDKTPEELMREEILKALGYTEEDLRNMDPEELAKVELKVKELIKIKIEQAMREDGVPVQTSQELLENAALHAPVMFRTAI